MYSGVAVAFCAMASASLAASDHATADGSAVQNPDILRQGYMVEGRQDPGHEPIAPFFDTEWTLGLRGAYVQDPDGQHFEAIVAPAVKMTHERRRQTLDFAADAEIVKRSDGAQRIAALRFSAATEYALDRVSRFKWDGTLALTQADASAPDLASNVLIAPVVIEGETEASLARQFGRFTLTGRASAGRNVSGPTTLDDLSQQDNSTSNVTSFGAGLRLGFEVTPRLSVFADVSRETDMFDLPSPTLLVKLDGSTNAVRIGATSKWGRFIDAEASIGFGLRQYEAGGLADVSSVLYEARLSYTPDETFTLSAELDTTIASAAPDSLADGEVEYTASAKARYVVNSWLALRAEAAWSRTISVGTPDTEEGYGFGVGADYMVNSHASIAADYSFGRSIISPDPAEDTHRVTLGLVFSN